MSLPMTRRTLLGSAVVVAGATVSGCALFDPTVSGRPTTTSSNTSARPTPAPSQVAAVQGLESLSRSLSAVGRATGVSESQKTWARACQAALGLQVLVVRRPDPLSGALPEPIIPPPAVAPAPLAIKAALTAVAAEAAKLSSQFEKVALTVPHGAPALLWGSLAVFAATCGSPASPPVDQKLLPHEFEAPTLAHAQGVLVEQLFRAEQAIAPIAGALPAGSLRTAMRDRYTGVSRLRVTVQNDMRASGATPPPPEPGYEVPQRPDASNLRPVLSAIETDLANGLAGVFCATDSADRASSFAAWAAQMPHVTQWTGVSRFPGWV